MSCLQERIISVDKERERRIGTVRQWWSGVQLEALLSEVNTAKGDWNTLPAEELWRMLVVEVQELGSEMVKSRLDPVRVREECADVANFAMMLAERVARK